MICDNDIMIKWPIREEDVAILNVYVPHNWAVFEEKYVKQKLIELKEEIDKFTIVVRDFNSPLSTIDRTTRQKINKDKKELNNTINQQDLINSYRTHYPKPAKYTFFSSTHGTCYKTNFSIFRSI